MPLKRRLSLTTSTDMQPQNTARPRPARALDAEDMLDAELDAELQTSTSAETVRHLRVPLHLTLSTTVSHTSRPHSPSQPSSPRSSLPSPSSPSGDSVSSFPSVSSSFLFSSGPGSPPHPAHHSGNDSEHEHEHGDSSLIIPSLTLPVPLRRPTPYGQGLGEVRLLVMGRKDVGITRVVDIITEEGYEDIVDVGKWEEFILDGPSRTESSVARVCRVSTDWIEHRDAHGLEKHEPSRNLEIIHLREYDVNDDPAEVIRNTLTYVHTPFHSVLSVVHPDQPPNDLLATLLSSSTTPFYTAMIIVTSHPLTPFEHTLIVELSTHIPLIILPPLPDSMWRRPSPEDPHDQPTQSSHALSRAHLSSIRPCSVLALRDFLFRRPDALATLRLEAADRFLRWREVERAVGHMLGSPVAESQRSLSMSQRTSRQNTTTDSPPIAHRRSDTRWDKSRWEAEWEGALATDVAKTVRTRRGAERRIAAVDCFASTTPMPRTQAKEDTSRFTEQTCSTNASRAQADAVRAPSFDPLHIPSLLAFSISLLTPLKAKVAQVLRFHSSPTRHDQEAVAAARNLQSDVDHSMRRWVLAGAFCAGIGVGILLARM